MLRSTYQTIRSPRNWTCILNTRQSLDCFCKSDRLGRQGMGWVFLHQPQRQLGHSRRLLTKNPQHRLEHISLQLGEHPPMCIVLSKCFYKTHCLDSQYKSLRSWVYISRPNPIVLECGCTYSIYHRDPILSIQWDRDKLVGPIPSSGPLNPNQAQPNSDWLLPLCIVLSIRLHKTLRLGDHGKILWASFYIGPHPTLQVCVSYKVSKDYRLSIVDNRTHYSNYILLIHNPTNAHFNSKSAGQVR